LVAIGNFLKIFLGTSYIVSLTLGTAVVILYSIFGGFFSVVITDSFQLFLLTIGLVGLFIFLLTNSPLGEISSIAASLGKNNYFNFFFDFKKNFLIFVSFTLAWIISPIVWQGIQSARTVRKARQGLFSSSVMFFILYWIVIAIGVFSLPFFSSKELNGPLLSVLISSKTGIFLSGMLFIALVAAIMSTMDTAINTGALTLTRDLYQQVFSDRKIGRIISVSRLSTLFVGVMAFLVATQFQSILKTIGLASEIMAEGMFIPGIAMIFLRKKMPMAGFLALVLGGGFSVISFLSQTSLIHLNIPSWPFSVPYGLTLSALGFIIGFGIERYRKSEKGEK